MDINFQNYFNIQLDPHQEVVFSKLCEFINDTDRKVYILKGYAGTGKTTIMGGFIRKLRELDKNFELLASTGRAAKILSDKTGVFASTAHSHLFHFKGLDQDLEKVSKDDELYAVNSVGQITLIFNTKKVEEPFEVIYIIDEASMISDFSEEKNSFARFGSGRLLSDILSFNPKAKFVFVGDPVQLPPIGQFFSPALSKDYFKKTFDIDSYEYELTKNKRLVNNTHQTNGIEDFSLYLRKIYHSYHQSNQTKWIKFQISGRRNITRLDSHAVLIDKYVNKIKANGFSSATLICQTNKKAQSINNLVRNMLFGFMQKIQIGDLLLITQNNQNTGLMNGDQVLVRGIANREYRCGLTFLTVELEELVSGKKVSTLLIEDVLYSNASNISSKQHKDLMIDFYKRMKNIGIMQYTKIFNDYMLEDPYLNGLRAVFGYALTCHKSQGGEWEEVYLYLDSGIQAYNRPEVYQWLYTAVTRTKKELFVVNDWFFN